MGNEAMGAIEEADCRRLLGGAGLRISTRKQLAAKGVAEPKCWSDLLDPKLKGEVQVADPNSSGTSYTLLATVVQLMGEDKGFDYMKKLHANINQYTKSGAAPAKATALGETTVGITFQHDMVVQILGGAPVKVVSPCEGTGYEIGSMSIVKGARNLDAARKFYDWALSPAAQKLAADNKAFQVPSEQGLAGAAASAEDVGDQAHRLRLREVRVIGGAQAVARQVGRRGQELPK